MTASPNLLPQSIRRARILRGRLRGWGTVVGAILVSLCAYGGWHARSHAFAEARLADDRAATAELLRLVDETAANRARLVQVQSQLAARERIVPTEDTLHVLDLIGRGHRRTFGRLSVGKLLVERRRVETAPTQPGGPPTTRETTHVEVTGVALDDASLSQFVTTLRMEVSSGRVELQSGAKVEVDGREVRQYVVVCAFD